MRYLLFLVILMASCSTSQGLPIGQWSGYLSQVDQRDKRLDLQYNVIHQKENTTLQIFGPRGINIETQGLVMTNDSLLFSFEKLDQTGVLSCGLKKVNKNYYYGTCSDGDGKIAELMMKHHSLNFSKDGVLTATCPCHS